MKKILTSLVAVAIFSMGADADMLKLEAGAGMWMQTPSGEMSYKDATDSSTKTDSAQAYAWIYFKHFIPVVPNLRLEYTGIENEGKANGSFKNFSTAGVLDINTKLEMTQIDIIPYYNILDNTFWMTIDLGLDIKVSEVTYVADGVKVFGFTMPGSATATREYKLSETLILPLGYLRARVQVPLSGFGAEADVKYISYDGNTVYDARIKVDYTFDITPVIQPALEVGYRVQKFEYEDSDDTAVNLEFSGVYVGAYLRF